MKKLILFLLFAVSCVLSATAQTPGWTKSMLDVYEMLRNVNQAWAKQRTDKANTLSLFPT